LVVQDGGSLTLPAVTSFSNPLAGTTFNATGTGSVLSLPALTSLSQLQSQTNIDASAGGQMLLPSVTSIDTSQSQQRVFIQADGSESEIDLSGLTSIAIGTSGSAFTVTHGATILDGKLTSFTGDSIVNDGTGTLAMNQWTSLVDDSLEIDGGSFVLSNLTDINSSSFTVQSGGSLSLPAVNSYSNPLAETAFDATDTGSVLSLPALASLAQLQHYLEIDVYQGGQILMPSVASGNLTTTVNPVGQTVQMAYDSLSDFTSITDADNNTTQYSYSPTGNLMSIAYPDGSQQSFTYNPLGNLSETIEQNGDPVGYQYDAQGLVTQENFADKTSESFTYDAHGNLLTARTYDSSGNLTGTTTLEYNAANELTSISYPGPPSLTFTDNAQGQRIQSVDQDGFTVNYVYDALGRLSKLTDGSDNLIVPYTYNNLGQLAEKQNGNGTYTTYAYDANGNLHTVTDASGTTTYTYNDLNQSVSIAAPDGSMTYFQYSPLGFLVGT